MTYSDKKLMDLCVVYHFRMVVNLKKKQKLLEILSLMQLKAGQLTAGLCAGGKVCPLDSIVRL